MPTRTLTNPTLSLSSHCDRSSVYRQQFPVDILLRLMPLLIAHLTATQAVVQTYAAHCVERLLNVKGQSEE